MSTSEAATSRGDGADETAKASAAAQAQGMPPKGMPLYHVVFQALRDEILSGRYDAAGMLPSELLLEERFEVSRITIRRACDELEWAALIERSKGRSARLLPRLPPTVTDVQREIEDHKAQHADMVPKVLHFAWITPDPVLAEMLDVSMQEKVLWVVRLRSRRGAPVSHNSIHIPHAFGLGISEELLGRMQLIDLWKGHGHRVASADQLMSAAPASQPVAKLLRLAVGDPIFCMRRLMRNADGRPMGLLYSSLRWDRFTYRMSLEQSETQAPATGQDGMTLMDQLVTEI